MDAVNIGKFLRDLRKEQNLTQEELGEQLGVTNKSISRWENGVYFPPVDILMRLSVVFNVTVNEILSGARLENADYQAKAEENIVTTLKRSQKLSRGKKIAIACCSVMLALALGFLAFYLCISSLFKHYYAGQFIEGTYEYVGEPLALKDSSMVEAIELTFDDIDKHAFKEANGTNVIKNEANGKLYKLTLSIKCVGEEFVNYTLIHRGSIMNDMYDYEIATVSDNQIPFGHVTIDVGVYGCTDEYDVVHNIYFHFSIRDVLYENGSRDYVILQFRNEKNFAGSYHRK